jgi:hypothetical protein
MLSSMETCGKMDNTWGMDASMQNCLVGVCSVHNSLVHYIPNDV